MDTQTLSGLLFGFDIAFGVRPRSRTNDFDFPPRIVPIEVGTAIKEIPGWESAYHIIAYETVCEVWPLSQWRDSVSRRDTFKNLAHHDIKKRSLHYSLSDAIQKRIPIRDVNTIATITAAIEEDKLTPELLKIFNLVDVVEEYKKQKATLNNL